jgi:hypothetical protein
VKLRDFFDTITPFLAGRASHEETARALYGPPESEADSGKDARRLALYGHFCRAHRFEVLEKLYPHCWREVRERHGKTAWGALVGEYHRSHPMRAFELNANGASLPEFLASHAPEAGLPDWLPELADLEWWGWEVLVAPDDEKQGPRPRLASAVELRPYRYDLVGWLDAAPAKRPESPEPRESLVLFWRDRSGHLRRENARLSQLRVLKALHEGHELDTAALGETLSKLIAAGIVLGPDDAG